MEEPFDRVLQSRSDDDLGAQDVGFEKGRSVVDRPWHMSFGGQMNDNVHVGHEFLDQSAVPDIAMVEAEVRIFPQFRRKVIQVAGIGEGVEHIDGVGRICQKEMLHEMAADESCTPCTRFSPVETPQSYCREVTSLLTRVLDEKRTSHAPVENQDVARF